MTDQFGGDIFTAQSLFLAVRGHVQQWMPDYLAAVFRARGRDVMTDPPFRSYAQKLTVDNHAEDQVPLCIITIPGTVATSMRARRASSATWAVGIASVVSGQTEEATIELAQLYTAALRTLFLQKPGVGGIVSGSAWQGERYDAIPEEAARTLAGGVVQFNMTVDTVSPPGGGPAAPSGDVTLPTPAWPEVETVIFEVDNEGVSA